MTFKPTLRRGGDHYITLRPRFDIGRTTVVAILAFEAFEDTTEYGDKPDADISRAEAERIISRSLVIHGSEHWDYAHEKRDEDDVERATEWAEGQVRRLYPEFYRRPAPAVRATPPV